MTGLERVLSYLFDITGLRQFVEATEIAHFWVSVSVLLRAVVALWLIVCTFIFSVRAVRVLLPRLGLPLRWAAIMGVGTWTATMGFHALRGLGWFNLPAAIVCCTALAAATVYVKPERAPFQWALRREWRGLKAVVRLFARSKYGFCTSLFCAFALLLTVRSLIVPPIGWDTITYHGPRAVHWLQTGQFTYDPGPGPYSFYRHFFSGGEVLMAWTLLPFHSDLLANLGGVVQWLGVGAATWALARALGVREPFAATAAGLAMVVPVLALEVNTGYVEAPLNFALLLGIAFAIQCLRRPSGPVAVAAAMSLGVAAGIKLPGAPPGVIVLAVLLAGLLFESSMKLSQRIRWVVLSAVLAALPILPFTYQAFVETGYPLSPMPVKLPGLTLGVSSPAMQWYQDRPLLVPFTWDIESAALRNVFSEVGPVNDWLGPSLFTPALIPLSVALIGLMVLLRRRPLIGVVIGGALAAPWFTHFSSGLSIPRIYWSVSVARYLIALMALAIPVSFAWCKADSTLAQTYRRILIIISLWTATVAARHGVGNWEIRELMIVGIVCLLMGTVVWLAFQARKTRAPWQLALVCVLLFSVGCSVLQLRRDQTRSNAYHLSYALHNWPRFWTNAVAFVDEPGVEHRIALTGGPLQSSDNWFNYFFFGSHFDNTIHYVPPTRDGGIAYFGPMGDFDQRADRDSWLSRIKKRAVTEVLTFPPQSAEQRWMDGLPERFEKLDGGFDWGLYRVRKQ